MSAPRRLARGQTQFERLIYLSLFFCDDEDNPSTANLAGSVLTVMLHFMDEVCVVLFVARRQPLYTFCAFSSGW